MPIDPKTGQEAGSPPAEGSEEAIAAAAATAAAAKEPEQGQEKVGSPTDTDDGAATQKDEDGEFIEKDGQKYYKSFDNHPEWRELKDAKDGFQTLLTEAGFKDKAELVTALKAGTDLTELIGDQDATALIEAADNWNRAEQYWAEQDALKTEEGESETETIARLKQEKVDLVNQQKTETDKQTAAKENSQAVQTFNTEITAAVEEAKLAEPEAALAKLFLGLDNPMDDVDIQSKKSIRLALTENIGKFRELVKTIKQTTVDDYVAGKKDITPIPTDDGGETTVPGSKFELKEGETPEEAVGRANAILIETLNAVKE